MFTREDLAALVGQGLTLWQIIERRGCSRSTVKAYIKQFGLTTPEGFYAREGCRTGRPKGFKHPEEFKLALSAKFSGEGNPFFGKKHTAETRKKMSDNHADVTGERNPFAASLRDPENLRKHRERCLALWAGRDDAYRRKFSAKHRGGCGEMPGAFWARVRSNAKVRGYAVEITAEEAWALFVKQGGCCQLSGLPLVFGQRGKATTASLDRVDSTRGYTADNVQWVHKFVNLMKNKLAERDFVVLCALVAANMPAKYNT